jgi:hypothetical protein
MSEPAGNDGGNTEAEVIVNRRNGDVLLKQTILKSDHFPGMTTSSNERFCAADAM